MTADGFTTTYKDQFGHTGYSLSSGGKIRNMYDDQKNINVGVNVHGPQATHNIREVAGEGVAEFSALAGKNISEAGTAVGTFRSLAKPGSILIK